jgi:hypothetical protein
MELRSKPARNQNPSQENVKEDFFIALRKAAARA